MLTKNRERVAKMVIESPLEFKGNDGKTYKLSLKEKTFCEKYLEYYGNGTEAAFEVYDCKDRKTAASIAAQNLIKLHITAYINIKLDEYGFNDENVKKHHLFLINQFGDLSAKGKGIDMHYKIKGSYAPEVIKHTLDESDIDERIREVKARIGAVGAAKEKD